MQEEANWYIEYDYKTLTILNNPDYQSLIYQYAVNLNMQQLRIPTNSEQDDKKIIPDWLIETAQSLKQIFVLLYNFYNVQSKLSKDVQVKSKFKILCTILKIQNLYCQFFSVKSMQLRVNRILACILRMNRFIKCILEEIKTLQKSMDRTLLDNLNEVYTFMQQRIMEILQATKTEQGARDITIILLDSISLLMHNSGDPTMKGILDINKQKQIIESILKQNEVYDEFMKKKLIARKNFEDNKYFEVQNPIEEDPNIKRSSFHENQEGFEEQSFD